MAHHEHASWLLKHKHIPVLIVLGLLWVQVIFQLFYPYDSALPNARLYDKKVVGQTRLALTGTIQKQFEAETFEVSTSSTSYSQTLASAGASINSEVMAKKLTDYPVWQRAIPFSLWWQRPTVTSYKISFNKAVLAKNAEIIAKKLSAAPVNADLALKSGELVVTEAKDGQTVNPESVAKAISSHTFTPKHTQLRVASTVAKPGVEDASISDVRHDADAKIARTYTLTLPSGEQVTPSKKTVTSWLTLKQKDGSTTLALNRAEIRRYISSLNGKVAIAAKPISVSVRDGREIYRTAGKDGSAISSSDLETKLVNALNSSETGVAMDVIMAPVSPGTVYNRTYSHSQAGLRAYVAYTTSSENVRIALQQIGGNNWSASGRSSESIPSASTYKLYVALWLFDQMNKGKIKWSDPWLDTNVSECFDRMTIASTNPCAVAWLESYGRDNMNNFVYKKGFSTGTSFTNPEAVHTTANDLRKYMIGLNNSSLVSGAQRTRLLHSLSVHPYRYGVPTGSAGTVQDKVGFLWDYVHDSAIVHHPKGTYVVVIMTKGAGGYARIASITRELERIMY